MCGIACLINNNGAYSPETLSRFTDAVSHRGPDGRGVALFGPGGGKIANSAEFRLGLGHRRLSIIDLSECGSQPMEYDGGNYVIVYNGEIYNYVEIRAELEKEAYVFKSHCDTEVLLAAYKKWGRNCLSRLNGMWAFAIYDRAAGKLFVSRDRIGIKPLYWRVNGNNLALASEIKQFFCLPDFSKKINAASSILYLATGYENHPETFFDGVFAFPPGHFAEINPEKPQVSPERFWFPEKISVSCSGDEDFSRAIRETFSDSVRIRLRSDVTVGGCLSGGLDSSSIFMMMKEHAPETTFNAFSACFRNFESDESPFMDLVCGKTGSRHIKEFPDPGDLASNFDKFLFHHDEPVGSASIFAQYKVMCAARKEKVPVLLDGQGGDELFSGYWPSYMLMLNNLKREGSYLKIICDLASSIAPGGNSLLVGEILKNFREFRRRAGGSYPFKLNCRSEELLASMPMARWYNRARELDSCEYRRAEILEVHLPRLLKWEDRNSMAFSIESRVPFLDYRLVELALSIPPQKNMRRGWNKFLFRNAMKKILPSEICWRKDKKGFETPQDRWMKEGSFNQLLKDWAVSPNHPVSDFISTDFKTLSSLFESGNFNPIQMFRLFCLDKWMASA